MPLISRKTLKIIGHVLLFLFMETLCLLALLV